MMKTILVATDFSENASHAAYYATALTLQIGISRLILYHSYDVAYQATDLPIPEPHEIQTIHKQSTEFLEYLKKDLESVATGDTIIEIHTDERPLSTGIEILCKEKDIRLIVMGTTGKSKMEKVLLGSNSFHIANECNIPLLLVPLESPVERIKRVVLATDLKNVAEISPVNLIKSFLHVLNAKLFILNVDNDCDQNNPETIKEQESLHQLWDSEDAEYHYTKHEDIAMGIMKFADEQQAQLVIAVPRKHGFFHSLFHRSLTEKLAYHSHIPLLFVKRNKWED